MLDATFPARILSERPLSREDPLRKTTRGCLASLAEREQEESRQSGFQQPRQYDLVGNPILIGGIGTGFDDGHDERTGHFTVDR